MKYKLHELFELKCIKGICLDSREAKPGYAFFAMKGDTLDGNMFIKDALSRGASLVFTDQAINSTDNVIFIDNTKEALLEAASILYPKAPSTLVAVTGTNGKSSVVSYYRQILGFLGIKAASIGTLGVECNDDTLKKQFNNEKYNSLTTPDIITFKSVLNDLALHNIDHLAFEASSHGLQQERFYGTQVNAAGFTSFSHDHLDYHKTEQAYLNAKLKLFDKFLKPGGIAIINSNMQEFLTIKNHLDAQSINFKTVGSSGDIKFFCTNESLYGQTINFYHNGNNREYSFFTHIIGSFQAINILIATLLVCSSGYEFNDVFDVLPKLVSVKGRLQRITSINSKFHVFVDYAHTPDALEQSLLELIKIKQPNTRLIVLFGCGGDRDKLKRPMMGNIASKFADYVIITDDNPRREDPASIRRDIVSGCGKCNLTEISDRREAIFYGINHLQDGDILLVAGKGHENYQIIGDKKIYFDDVAVGQDALHGRITV